MPNENQAPKQAETDDQIFARLVAEELKNSGMFEFDGMNCNDYSDDDAAPCEGWDGVDRRCQCGNRRVGWELSDCKTFISAVAY